MADDKLPDKAASRQVLSAFLDSASQLPQRVDSDSRQTGRLIFALDATASRQPSWDQACQLQSEMFTATDSLGGLQLQLCYYQGFHEFHYSPWLSESRSLRRTMNAVQCLGGYTQLGRVLEHSLKQHKQQAIQAVIIIADAMEESVDVLCDKAGQLGLLGVPLFMFQEGNDPAVQRCFQQMATLSKGAYATFDAHSAQQLAHMLAAVATYASGGFTALQQLQSSAARQLLTQLKS
ncbi:hypothetical protein [Oceanicoccus sp. KOV_DT_Chl]|uniref:hypothetical protein n=1 Tax=Oceanicoccus sp. KOV_DT_Chl TaxID=1904639 RepID=UPI000C7D96D0|nr:hypothetical protein [Oceanicoccus sp. KOV_DT_Chl]